MSALGKYTNVQKILSDVLGFDEYGMDQLRTVEWGRKYLWALRFIDSDPSTQGDGKSIKDNALGLANSYGAAVASKSGQLGANKTQNREPKTKRNVPKPPFDKFFPASDIEFPVGSLDSYAIEKGQSSYKIPQRGQAKNLSITFFDDNNSTLLRWMRDWIELDILNNGQFVSCLLDSHQTVGKDSFGEKGQVYPVRTVLIEQLTPQFEPTGMQYRYDIYPEGEITFSGGSQGEANIYTVNFVIVGDNVEKTDPPEPSVLDIGIKTLGRFI